MPVSTHPVSAGGMLLVARNTNAIQILSKHLSQTVPKNGMNKMAKGDKYFRLSQNIRAGSETLERFIRGVSQDEMHCTQHC